jgi:hypothetical protein
MTMSGMEFDIKMEGGRMPEQTDKSISGWEGGQMGVRVSG